MKVFQPKKDALFELRGHNLSEVENPGNNLYVTGNSQRRSIFFGFFNFNIFFELRGHNSSEVKNHGNNLYVTGCWFGYKHTSRKKEVMNVEPWSDTSDSLSIAISVDYWDMNGIM
ncbi:hypothetical protein NE237_028321 [Protea cynaroides]|uniref:Uncharacterized protein n=1 Tax=Protea cynaroides TaxID=273540 RepID=A0A9Q0GTK0_9MAGN|nr:hypothetical protein NE237_028321 [Protea cynaroides]